MEEWLKDIEIGSLPCTSIRIILRIAKSNITSISLVMKFLAIGFLQLGQKPLCLVHNLMTKNIWNNELNL